MPARSRQRLAEAAEERLKALQAELDRRFCEVESGESRLKRCELEVLKRQGELEAGVERLRLQDPSCASGSAHGCLWSAGQLVAPPPEVMPSEREQACLQTTQQSMFLANTFVCVVCELYVGLIIYWMYRFVERSCIN